MAKKVKKYGFGGGIGVLSGVIANAAKNIPNLVRSVGPGFKPTTPPTPAPTAPTPNPRRVNPVNIGRAPTGGPMVPVRGGGMAPASVATMMKKGGKVSSASKRADGCATKGKTKGKMV